MRYLAVKNMLERASEVLFLVLSFLATRKLLNFVEQYPSKSDRIVQEVGWIFIQAKFLESWSPNIKESSQKSANG